MAESLYQDFIKHLLLTMVVSKQDQALIFTQTLPTYNQDEHFIGGKILFKEIWYSCTSQKSKCSFFHQLFFHYRAEAQEAHKQYVHETQDGNDKPHP